MKVLIALTTLFALGSAQFGRFGGSGLVQNLSNAGTNLAGNLVNTAQKGLGSVTTLLPPVPVLKNVKNFEDFLRQTGKNYTDPVERQLRKKAFDANKCLVDLHNSAFKVGKKTYALGVNAFSDLTHDEFLKQLTGNKRSSAADTTASKYRQEAKVTHGYGMPDGFDWREYGGVSPVQFQGTCGSCWSFAVTGAVEGHVFRKTNKLPILSVQNLVDCGDPNMGLEGCDGGFQDYGFDLIVKQKGIVVAEKYPYVGKADTCKYKKKHSGAEITGYAVIPPNDEETMKEVIATMGPVACSLNAIDSLMLYQKGIYADEKCNIGEVNHAVLIVGYGVENGQDYWIIKNSWDTAWGEDGYFRLVRGKNFCGIASECSYPRTK